MAKVPYYRGVRGSAALATHALGAGAPAESIAPGEMRRVAFAGELLGAVRVRAGFAAIPLEAFDRASADLEAEEQAAYLHLLRLSVAEGRNWCRVPKKELMQRLRLSERRLLRVLDALVARRYLRPLDRDNRGTLWRVYLPREAAGQPVGDEVILGRAPELRVVRSGRVTVRGTGTATATSARAERPVVTARPVPTDLALAVDLAAARGRADPEGLAAALAEVRELLAEGQPPRRITACIETVRRRASRAGRGDPP